MKFCLTFICLTIALTMSVFANEKEQKMPSPSSKTASHTAYDFSFTSLTSEEPLALSTYKGKVIMVVNTASKCGFTGQYDGLETLYKTYKDKGLVIIGVPSNDFGAQEPGSKEDIATFCKKNYGVTFPMAGKEIVSGANAHPFYQWAYDVLGFGTAPKWNFHKYVIGRDGQLVDYFNSTTEPTSANVIKVIESALDKK